VLWVVAAGNKPEHHCDASLVTPQNLSLRFPNVITVAAVARDGSLASYSHVGEPVSVAAPGGELAPPLPFLNEGVYSTFPSICPHVSIAGFYYEFACPDDYKQLAGTSMAAPYVTGLAALVLSAHPTYSASQVRWCIVRGAENSGRAIDGYEFNVIDAPAAVACQPEG
jgi:serine protease